MLLTLWATPRSTSTAFEWMMRQRGDFECFHELWNEVYYSGEDRQSERDRHGKHWPDCTFEEAEFDSPHRVFHRVADRTGHVPPVMHSSDLLDDPEGTTRAFCRALGVPYIAEALSWEAGNRSEVAWYGEGTGPWHDNLRASTGIQKPTTEYPSLDDNPRLSEIYERCLPLFDDLKRHTLAPIADVATAQKQGA